MVNFISNFISYDKFNIFSHLEYTYWSYEKIFSLINNILFWPKIYPWKGIVEAKRAKITIFDWWHKNSIFSIFSHSDHIFAIAQNFTDVMDQTGHTSKKCMKAVQRRAEGLNSTFSQKKRWKWPKIAIFLTYSWENLFFFTESKLAQKNWIVKVCSINSNY